jgi:hypothetical protein
MTATAKTKCVLFQVSSGDFTTVLNVFPKARLEFYSVANSRERRFNHAKMPSQTALQIGDENGDTEDLKTTKVTDNDDFVRPL